MQLIGHSMATRTWHTYHRAWAVLQTFLAAFHISPTLPVSAINVAFFVPYLWQLQYAPNTVSTYTCAVGYLHKLNGFDGPTTNFLVQKAVRGIHRRAQPQDTRLPISYTILGRLTQAFCFCSTVRYRTVMFRSMFLLAFFAFLRIGEITISNEKSDSVPNILTFQQLHFGQGGRSVTILFRHYKHSSGRPAVVKLLPQNQAITCPVAALNEYLTLRGTSPGFLYQWPSGTPISRADFTDILSKCLRFCNLSPEVYKGHCFRIGAATPCASIGMSDGQIRPMGRWKSDAFKRYVRF